MRPPVSRIAVAALFAISAANQLVQVPGEFGGDEALPMLGLLHLAAGAPGLATAWGAWFARRWAWMAALAWGIGTAALILSLEGVLGLSAQDAEGMRPAAAVVAVLAGAAAWYLWRAARPRAAATASSAAS
jgi:hypothetical protein